ncbi:pollen-specific leucine-rich repeat extensin-like protein 3 [Iris pallida]|uniref:Pollen-specific leucine-rich repeat extensin-like protein 3 n=1 Tax=Iris pallida TaxID=29817 RepID=A0AAX6HYI0_IRIPA|nr:pollen-specific leucine-rich repeat extensin-like protein 3 [Iris pallida]
MAPPRSSPVNLVATSSSARPQPKPDVESHLRSTNRRASNRQPFVCRSTGPHFSMASVRWPMLGESTPASVQRLQCFRHPLPCPVLERRPPCQTCTGPAALPCLRCSRRLFDKNPIFPSTSLEPFSSAKTRAAIELCAASKPPSCSVQIHRPSLSSHASRRARASTFPSRCGHWSSRVRFTELALAPLDGIQRARPGGRLRHPAVPLRAPKPRSSSTCRRRRRPSRKPSANRTSLNSMELSLSPAKDHRQVHFLIAFDS